MPLSETELERIAGILKDGPYPGYPLQYNRLFFHSRGTRWLGDQLTVPHGPWHISGHDNRDGRDETLLDLEVPEYALFTPWRSQERWIAAGLKLDQYGRPIHPDWRQLLDDSRIGLPTGLGFFWRYGPNATVDPVLYRRTNGVLEFLLIKRKIGGQWAFPGGFVDIADCLPAMSLDDAYKAAAVREAGEETALDASGPSEIILRRRSVGLRDTLHAWTENVVVLIHGDQSYLHHALPMCGDDAVDVGWYTRSRTAELDMYDAHAIYLDYAVEFLAESQPA